MKLPFLTLLFLLIAWSSGAQRTAPSDREAARNPVWIPMMDDTLANYFAVERAFTTYFAHHQMSEGEHDIIGEHAERERRMSRRKQRRLQKEEELRMAVKRYYFWHDQNLPYVQQDGRILTPSERIAIWKSQQAPQK